MNQTASLAGQVAAPLMPASGPERQRDVQRLLGRCLLRIQQYERLLKAILASHELVGTPENLEAERQQRVQLFANKTLGQLAKSLFETYIVPEAFERDLLVESKPPLKEVSIALSARMVMTPERREQAKASIEDLVELRNDLVHHLIEKFDLWSEAGCVTAVEHLEGSYKRVDRHFAELAGWARSMEDARVLAAGVAQSPAFIRMVVDGIAPDGAFDWPMTGIVCALREAAVQLAETGWTRLDHAREWITQMRPEQTPQKYGYQTWPQVLNESKLFDLQYRPSAEGRKLAWYRERPAREGR